MKAAVLVFPGSNCDRDLGESLVRFFSCQVQYIWHKESFFAEHDIYFLPGGFSYGDYLRSGALAAHTRSMSSLREAVAKGRMVVGICNGFQILTESKLLPGALLRNKSLKHICKDVPLKGENEFQDAPNGFSLPISHSEGNYIAPYEILQEIEENRQVLFRYRENPNGSLHDIAGLCDKSRRVIGLMPHPERALFPTKDKREDMPLFGRYFFEKIFSLL
ncbi:MAG: phosphoribosylformylglycinamidine synthase subunit PurQ [Leptospiraceae bacterium]|nr:phosphoribosylformylglycinamidine synthase subunit PurQ [Leptospiraceae bacterium]